MLIRDMAGTGSIVCRSLVGGKHDWTVKWDGVRGEKPETLTGPRKLRGYEVCRPPAVSPAAPTTPVGPPRLDSASETSSPPSVSRPEHWTPEGPFLDITPSRRSSAEHEVEYNDVKASFVLEGASVQQVWRVQNERLWRLYGVERDALGGEANEKLVLWHSTCVADPFLICQDGFDLSYAKEISQRTESTRKPAYGLGIYFAEHPLYSHCICPCFASSIDLWYKGYFIIRARVLLGKCHDFRDKVAEGRLRAPDGCHSWTGTEGNMKNTFDAQALENNPDARRLKREGGVMGRQYITQRYSMIYPEYVIRYTRE